jgi:hypothetical protein
LVTFEQTQEKVGTENGFSVDSVKFEDVYFHMSLVTFADLCLVLTPRAIE